MKRKSRRILWGYQLVVDGIPRNLMDLTAEELRHELARCIDLIERIDQTPGPEDLIFQWRMG